MTQYLCLVCFVCLSMYPFCCRAVTPHEYIPAMEGQGEIQTRETLLRKYFNLGFSILYGDSALLVQIPRKYAKLC